MYMNGLWMNEWIHAGRMHGMHGPIFGGYPYMIPPGFLDGLLMNELGMMRDGRPDGTSMAGANIFKGTCKYYDTRRGFGFIVPVCAVVVSTGRGIPYQGIPNQIDAYLG